MEKLIEPWKKEIRKDNIFVRPQAPSLLPDAATVERLQRPLADKSGNINQLTWTGQLDNVTRPSDVRIENELQIRQRVEVLRAQMS
jgi:hypothetical protein